MRTAFVSLACLLLVGCINTRVTRLDHAVRPQRAPESVAVLEKAPEGRYVLIAVLEAKSGAVFDSFDDLRDDMVAEAARLGGDALILGPRSAEEGFLFTHTAMIRTEERRLVGQVIVYDRPGAS